MNKTIKKRIDNFNGHGWTYLSVSWRLNGELHRKGRPAVKYADGTKMWFLNGKRHREGGPSVEW